MYQINQKFKWFKNFKLTLWTTQNFKSYVLNHIKSHNIIKNPHQFYYPTIQFELSTI